MKELCEHLKEVERGISYFFNNKELLIQAFTRRSYTQENGGMNNETLEFIGDRVLDFYVTKIIIDRFGQVNEKGEFSTHKYTGEGSLTELKKKFVNKKMLANRIDKLNFKEYLRMGNGDIQSHQEDEDSVKEDLFEAILGAIALDSEWNSDSLENSVNFMLNMDTYLTNGFTEEDDYVGLLQQWQQRKDGTLPNYEFVELDDGRIEVTLDIETKMRGKVHYINVGSSKSEARLKVALKAYKDLEEHRELFTILDELPEELTLDNAINTLQELAQKGYISMPEYSYYEEMIPGKNNEEYWQCKCYIRSYAFSRIGHGKSKKNAKKYAAYLCICYICGIRDQYQFRIF